MANFSDFTQDDLDRQDQAKRDRSFKSALTRRYEKERAKRDAHNDLERLLILGESTDRDLYAGTVTYRKEYRKEIIRLTSHE